MLGASAIYYPLAISQNLLKALLIVGCLKMEAIREPRMRHPILLEDSWLQAQEIAGAPIVSTVRREGPDRLQ